nr:MAG: putative capsid protein [Arizlama virus]
MPTRSGLNYHPGTLSTNRQSSITPYSLVGGALATLGRMAYNRYYNYPTAVRAAYTIGRAFRRWRTGRTASASRPMISSSRGRVAPSRQPFSRRVTGAPMRRTRRGRYRPMKRGYQVKRGRMRRGGRRGRSSTLSKIVRMFTTPQVCKVTFARNAASAGVGLRTWYADWINTRANVDDMYLRRPLGMLNQATGTGSAAETVAYGSSQYIHVSSFVQKWTLQNRSNWDMELKVYECIVRDDQDVGGAATTFVTALFGTSYADRTLENQDYHQPAYAGAGDGLTAVYQNPSYTPYMSTSFCECFKVIKTTPIKLGVNDYVSYVVRCGKKRFATIKLDHTGGTSGYTDLIGRWTKMLVFTWVGGPIDDSTTGTEGKQSKSIADLFMQCDMTYKFWCEPGCPPLYNIASSNATANQLGYDTQNNYSTLTAMTQVIPVTAVVETSADAEVDPENP